MSPSQKDYFLARSMPRGGMLGYIRVCVDNERQNNLSMEHSTDSVLQSISTIRHQNNISTILSSQTRSRKCKSKALHL